MIIRKLSRAALEQRPYEVWNAFVSLLAKESYQDLDEVQRAAHLCFWYDSEVQNGGHLQYFENRGIVLLNETLEALLRLKAECQHTVLQKASGLFKCKPRDRIATVEDYLAAARSGEFTAADSAYHLCKPVVLKLLADYLEKNKGHFIEVTYDDK